MPLESNQRIISDGAAHDQYIDFDKLAKYVFTDKMLPDFLHILEDVIDEDVIASDFVYGVDEYKAIREAQKDAADAAFRLYKLHHMTHRNVNRMTALFISLTRAGRPIGQWQLDAIVEAYKQTLVCSAGAKKHHMAPEDFIDMVLIELAALALTSGRGAA